MLKRNQNTRLKSLAMSIEKPSKVEDFKKDCEVKEILHRGNTTRIHALLQQGIPVPPTPDPPQKLESGTTLLKINLPAMVNAVQRTRHLVFKQSTYIISNWTSDKFPNVLYIGLNNFSDGYRKLIGGVVTATSSVAALQLEQVTSILDESQVRTYQLKYMLRDCVNWEIPLTLNEIALSIFVDDSITPEPLPLPNPLSLNFQIRRQ